MTASVRSILAATQLSLLGGLLLVAAIVVLRRLAGGLAIPLSTAQLAIVGAALAATSLAVRLVWVRVLRDRAAACWWHDYVTRFVPLAACALLAGSVLLPSTPVAGACLLILVLAVEETWSLTRLSSVRSSRSAAGELGLDESLDQQLVRRHDANGGEVIAGHVRVPFAAGQRTAEAHVAFCPPFSERPQVEYEAAGGPDARIELGKVLPLGARLDVKLARAAAKDVALVIRFTARAPAAAPLSEIAPVQHRENELRIDRPLPTTSPMR